MIEIIPAILPKSFDELEECLQRLQGVAPTVQIDLVDVNVLLGHEALPFWEEFDFECDVMLANPAREMQSCIDIGASRVVVHARAANAHEALQSLQDFRGGNLPVLVGVALASTDTLDALAPYEELYDFVQVMGIANVGHQGQPFDEKCLALIALLRATYPELVIQVDGAVTLSRVRALVDAGANRLVVGSALMQAENPGGVYKALYTEANAQ